MSDRDRILAASFAIGNWRDTFAAIDDDSETLVAGIAEWILVTTYEAKSEHVYYMVTAAGLHVGQKTSSKGRLFRGTSSTDHFLPRTSIVAADTDHQRVAQFDADDGSRVIIWFADVFGQFSDHFVDHKPASEQAQTVATALGWPLGT